MDKELICMIILYLISYIFAIKIAVALKDVPIVQKVQESCMFSLECEPCTRYRGKNYHIGNMDEIKEKEVKDCLVTFWSMTHLLLYMGLGYLCPSYFWLVSGIGIGFEILEYYVWDCMDPMDIIFNTIGFGLGTSLKYVL